MGIFNRSILKGFFSRGKYPTQDQFAGLIDSFIHKSEDIITLESIQGLSDALGGKADIDSIETHAGDRDNPHKVTKAQLGLGNVDNTADTDKPISSLAQAALDSKADEAISQERFNEAMSLINEETLQQVCKRGNATTINLTIPSAIEDCHAATFAQVRQLLQEALQALANRVGDATEDVTVAFLKSEIDKLNILVSSDDLNLDTIQEIVAFIKSNRDVIDTISTNKADRVHEHSVASKVVPGFMSVEDKTKLDNIVAGANKYTHPSSHPATMITEDVSHRFASDTEKSIWNSALKAADIALWAKQPDKPSYTAAEVGAAGSNHSHGGINNVRLINVASSAGMVPDTSALPNMLGSITSYLYKANAGVEFSIALPAASNHITPFGVKTFPAGAAVELSVTNYGSCYVWTFCRIR